MQICPKKCIFHASPSAPSPAPAPASPPHRSPAADCRLCAPGASAAPVLHPAWQNLAPARPRTGRRLQTVPPRTLPPRRCQFAPPARPGTAGSHRLPAPSGTASSYRLPTPPGTTRALAPASHLQTAKRRAHRNGRRGVNTQRGVSARRLTRQLRKSPRPQRRHLRCRLLARPLRERQRPQEQQR